ncbi:hypothetical protein [Phenylobacterium montanum]|uniref:Uncharacterized protein n=1 Tax=Phenylobacterium montanum TaxID=2823693 RepID=A0A975G030_9CAUL|nr:hypothetical protein [Caulobacter sp. S6]QUD88043.1 hypothetical protein KCG34_23930 [Caulobacter sp. S6]
MRSNPIDRWRHFRSDVDREITFLLNRYGEQAYQAALAAAARPDLRTRRRKVLKAVARALDPAPRLLWIFRLPAGKLGRTQLRARAARSAPSLS